MSIKGIFERWRTKKVMTKLSKELRIRYGGSATFTSAQVATTLKDLAIKQKYHDLSYFLYCSPEEFGEFGFYAKDITRLNGLKNRIESQSGSCGSLGSFNFDGGDSGGD